MGDQDTISLYNIFQYNIKQTSDEHKEKYKLRNWKLIKYQILQTNITRTVWQTVWRITNEILGVTGLSSYASTGNCKKIIVEQKCQSTGITTIFSYKTEKLNTNLLILNFAGFSNHTPSYS